jgi:hypothetical protein
VVADPSELQVERGGRVVIIDQTAETTCDLHWGDAPIVVIDGEPALTPGTEVTVQTPDADTEIELTCANLEVTPELLLIVGDGKPHQAVQLVDDSGGIVLEPADITVPLGTILAIENTTHVVCPLEPASAVPEIVEGTVPIEPGETTSFALPQDEADIKLYCNVTDGQSFMIRTRPAQ